MRYAGQMIQVKPCKLLLCTNVFMLLRSKQASAGDMINVLGAQVPREVLDISLAAKGAAKGVPFPPFLVGFIIMSICRVGTI